MPAPSKSWTNIPDTSIDADSPLDETLVTALRDDLVHLREWLGHGFTAEQAHNHDGVNSALIGVGPSYLRNGGFENDLAGWTTTTYTGGTIAVGTSHETEGTKGLVITSTVAANGGGKVESGFIGVTASQVRQFMMTIKASGATVPIKAEVLWYDDAQAAISASTIISITASPTTDRLVVRRIAAPSTAKFCKLRLELPTGAGGTGSVYFDDVAVVQPAMLGGQQVFTGNGTFSAVWGDVFALVQAGGGEGGDGSNNGANGSTSSFSSISATGGAGGVQSVGGGAGGAAGAGSGGNINRSGAVGGASGGLGGTTMLGGGSPLNGNGTVYGSGGGGVSGGGGGGGGGYAEGQITISADVSVVVSGTANGSSAGGTGAAGIVIVRW